MNIVRAAKLNSQCYQYVYRTTVINTYRYSSSSYVRHWSCSNSLLCSNRSVYRYYIKALPADILLSDLCARQLCTTPFRRSGKPTSKIEETVNCVKQKAQKVNETQTALVKPKVSIKQKVIDELKHYYHGFKLLGLNIKISSSLAVKKIKGQELTRREHNLVSKSNQRSPITNPSSLKERAVLVQTMADLFRLVPFSVFIVVPFLEFTLPIFIKIFPGMLPTTFQTSKDQETKLKQSLKVKLEMAKFLQETLNNMCVARKSYTCESAKEFADFFAKVRQKGVVIPADDILKFSKLFKDDITLDSLGRPQLMALCRVLDIRPIGTSNVLIWQIKLKLRSLAIDDKVIQKEGVDSLSLNELQQACKARGMRAYGLAKKRLRQQLTQWLDLSLNEKVPPSLLILSSAFGFTENIPTSDLLVKAISSLPYSVGVSTEADLGEREGAIDNKVKLEATKVEKQKCEEERKEHIEESKVGCKITPADFGGKSNEGVSTKDLKTLECAIENLEKKKLIVEKEEIKELKGELKCYQKDIKKLQDVMKTEKEEKVSESRAAKRLFKQVNNMIKNMDLAVKKLEEKEKQIKKDIKTNESAEGNTERNSELIKIDEIIGAVKKLQSVPDGHRLQKISQVLSKIDIDNDGSIQLDTVLKVLQLIGTENVKLSPKEMEMITQLVIKEKEMNDKTNDGSKNQ